MSKKKSAFRVLTEAISTGKMRGLNLPEERIRRRRLTVDEIKKLMREEFGKAKEASDIEAEERPKGWGDDALEKELDWMKKLEIKEFFKKEKK